VVERKNITIVECARSMLKHENLSNTLWVEDVSTTMYVQNRIPTKLLEHKKLYEAFSGYKHVVSHLSIIGSKEISHIPNEDRRKLDGRSVKYIISLDIVLTIRLTKCMIILLTNYLQVGMLYSMSMHMMMMVKMYICR
jgi:hypothetical protein